MSFIRNVSEEITNKVSSMSLTNASAENVTFLGGDGNDTVIVKGNKNTIDTEAGNDKIIVVGNENIVADSKDDSNIAITGDCNAVVLGDGKDTVKVIGNNTAVCKEDGKLLMGAVGDGTEVSSNAKENVIGAYGNNCKFNFGDESVSDVRSLDYWLEDGSDNKFITLDDGTKVSLKDCVAVTDENGQQMTLNYYDNSTAERKSDLAFFKNNFSAIYDELTHTSSEKSDPVVLSDEIIGANKQELADKYFLSPSEREILNSVDLNAKYSDGSSLYSIVFSPRRQQYVVVKRDGASHSRAVADNECIAFNANLNSEYAEEHKRTEKYTVTDTYTMKGVSNWEINVGKGKISAAISTTEGNIDIQGGETLETQNINVTSGHIATKVSENVNTYNYQTVVKILGACSANTWNSPLVLDMNGDGKVSAEAGKGVDINNDGKADGAAANGDKMLAMSDINGNNRVDGNEVFGDQTVSPFTGKAILAKNGFEALKILAQQAKEYTGINCINGSKVDVQKLAKALEKVGIKLGFISDDNTTNVEDLYGVKYIDVENYKENDDKGNVQHRQQSSFETESGETRKVDDVWFAV